LLGVPKVHRDMILHVGTFLEGALVLFTNPYRLQNPA